MCFGFLEQFFGRPGEPARLRAVLTAARSGCLPGTRSLWELACFCSKM